MAELREEKWDRGPRRLTKRSREDEERCAACSQERQVESAHSPRTTIALDRDKRLDRSTLGHGPPHQSIQSNPR